ncbi:MAG: hypothetical protein AAF591_22535 [Verrucomicrobiota bacterium]
MSAKFKTFLTLVVTQPHPPKIPAAMAPPPRTWPRKSLASTLAARLQGSSSR